MMTQSNVPFTENEQKEWERAKELARQSDEIRKKVKASRLQRQKDAVAAASLAASIKAAEEKRKQDMKAQSIADGGALETFVSDIQKTAPLYGAVVASWSMDTNKINGQVTLNLQISKVGKARVIHSSNWLRF